MVKMNKIYLINKKTRINRGFWYNGAGDENRTRITTLAR